MISPEMHWYFDQNATVWHTLASGFYDSIGWFIDVKFQEKKQIEELMAFFDLTEHKDQLLHTLPLGKQRLAMLARSISKILHYWYWMNPAKAWIRSKPSILMM